MHTWAPFNPEDYRMSMRRLLSAWIVGVLFALAPAVQSAISRTETNDQVAMTGCAVSRGAVVRLAGLQDHRRFGHRIDPRFEIKEPYPCHST